MSDGHPDWVDKLRDWHPKISDAPTPTKRWRICETVVESTFYEFDAPAHMDENEALDFFQAKEDVSDLIVDTKCHNSDFTEVTQVDP